MRIVGYIEHPVLKITVLMMNMKYAVKLEAGLMEQTYKLRESEQVTNLEDIKKLLDEPFIAACLEQFHAMQRNLFAAYDRDMSRLNK